MPNPVKDGETGGRTCNCGAGVLHGFPHVPLGDCPDAPLPVAEFECWTCKARTEETGRPWPWQLDEYAANQHRKAYHDIRPAGGKRP